MNNITPRSKRITPQPRSTGHAPVTITPDQVLIAAGYFKSAPNADSGVLYTQKFHDLKASSGIADANRLHELLKALVIYTSISHQNWASGSKSTYVLDVEAEKERIAHRLQPNDHVQLISVIDTATMDIVASARKHTPVAGRY